MTSFLCLESQRQNNGVFFCAVRVTQEKRTFLDKIEFDVTFQSLEREASLSALDFSSPKQHLNNTKL